MNRREEIGLQIQYMLGRIFIFISAPVISLAFRLSGYTVSDLSEVRKGIETRLKAHKGPWLICANHLTMVDSVLIAYVLFPFYRYMIRYRLLPWNLPDQANLHRIHPVLAGLCYLLKCIPVVRGGSRDALHTSIVKCAHVLQRGEILAIFPEGGRSRTGRIDTENFPYGVGRFVSMVPDSRVLCLYIRGDHQVSCSDFPKSGENFFAAAEDFKPSTQLGGLKAQRDLARKIIEKLSEMEKAYFDARGK